MFWGQMPIFFSIFFSRVIVDLLKKLFRKIKVDVTHQKKGIRPLKHFQNAEKHTFLHYHHRGFTDMVFKTSNIFLWKNLSKSKSFLWRFFTWLCFGGVLGGRKPIFFDRWHPAIFKMYFRCQWSLHKLNLAKNGQFWTVLQLRKRGKKRSQKINFHRSYKVTMYSMANEPKMPHVRYQMKRRQILSKLSLEDFSSKKSNSVRPPYYLRWTVIQMLNSSSVFVLKNVEMIPFWAAHSLPLLLPTSDWRPSSSSSKL